MQKFLYASAVGIVCRRACQCQVQFKKVLACVFDILTVQAHLKLLQHLKPLVLTDAMIIILEVLVPRVLL
jgi:hypothetical protein